MRALIWFAALGVAAIAVPVFTVLIRPENRGGYNPEYSIDRVVVHWIAVVGVSLLILALARRALRLVQHAVGAPRVGVEPFLARHRQHIAMRAVVRHAVFRRLAPAAAQEAHERR